MPINRLYHTWFCHIRELHPNQRVTQVRNFVWLLVGIHPSRSVCLSRIAGKISGAAKLTRRLSRTVDLASNAIFAVGAVALFLITAPGCPRATH